MNLSAILSVSIGLLNLFPVPLLDGGHLLFYAIEAVRGKPLSERAQEMGFRIARKHSAKLRRITQALAFAAPAILLATVYFLPWPIGAIASVLAAIAQLAGMLVERWLFFAEAKHTVTLYYGR